MRREEKKKYPPNGNLKRHKCVLINNSWWFRNNPDLYRRNKEILRKFRSFGECGGKEFCIFTRKYLLFFFQFVLCPVPLKGKAGKHFFVKRIEEKIVVLFFVFWEGKWNKKSRNCLTEEKNFNLSWRRSIARRKLVSSKNSQLWVEISKKFLPLFLFSISHPQIGKLSSGTA